MSAGWSASRKTYNSRLIAKKKQRFWSPLLFHCISVHFSTYLRPSSADIPPSYSSLEDLHLAVHVFCSPNWPSLFTRPSTSWNKATPHPSPRGVWMFQKGTTFGDGLPENLGETIAKRRPSRKEIKASKQRLQQLKKKSSTVERKRRDLEIHLRNIDDHDNNVKVRTGNEKKSPSLSIRPSYGLKVTNLSDWKGR